jgi:uncharacterized membrane protein
VLNLLLLLGVVAIPFPTSLVAEHLTDKGGPVATVSYGLVMIAISVGFTGLWLYVVTNGEKLGAAAPREEMLRSLPGYSIGLAVYVAGTVVAVWLPGVALAVFGALAVYYLFEHLPSPRGEPEPG